MSEIPDDVMRVARKVAAEVWKNAGLVPHRDTLFGSADGTTGVQIAAKSILAEREAITSMCMKLAQHQKERSQFQDAFTSEFIAKNIASANHIKKTTKE